MQMLFETWKYMRESIWSTNKMMKEITVLDCENVKKKKNPENICFWGARSRNIINIVHDLELNIP